MHTLSQNCKFQMEFQEHQLLTYKLLLMIMRLESFPRICSKDTFNCGFSFQLLKINSQPVQAPTSFVKVIVQYLPKPRD